MLLPAFGVTVSAMLLEWLLFSPQTMAGIGAATFIVGCAFLGAVSFGEEFHQKTMPLVLVQPGPRKTVWWDKMLPLGTALGVVFIVFLAVVRMRENPLVFCLIPLAVFCSGPGQTLLVKNQLIGAVMTFSVPLLIWLGLVAVYSLVFWASPETGFVLRSWLENYPPETYIAAGVAMYCGGSYWWSYRRFLRLEVIEAQAQEIRLPARIESILARPAAMFLPRYSGPFASLVRKEVGLQKPVFIVAGAACVAGIVEAVIRLMHQSEFITVLLITNVVICCLIPFIACGISVAEERSMGLMGWQRCLPPPTLKQWLAKLLVVFGTSGLLGILLPMLMITAGLHVFRHEGFAEILMQLLYFWGWLLSSGGALVYLSLLSLAILASSLATNTFRALLLAIALIATCGSAAFWPVFEKNVGLVTPVFAACWPLLLLLVVLLQILAYRNYLHLDASTRRCWTQSGLLVLASVFFGLFFIVAMWLGAP